MRADHIEAVIKVTERCNINCDYCYVYHKGNTDFEMRPPLMKADVFESIATFLRDGVQDLNAGKLTVVFHGGEPLLLKKNLFDRFCENLRTQVPQKVSVEIGVQTNAMLIDRDWIDLFHKHRVMPSISLDGPAEVHDRHRRDHRNRGTHARVLEGLARLQAAAKLGIIPEPGAICVIDPQTDARKIYRYFVGELGLRHISFHLPMDTYETGGWIDVPSLTTYLTDLFDEWAGDDDPNIRIRMFEEFMGHLLSRRSTGAQQGQPAASIQHITVSTDGSLGVDELKPAGVRQDVYTVFGITMKEYVQSDVSRYLRSMYSSIPTDCGDCVWSNYCRGGARHGVAVNRWSNENGFNNRSLICDSLSAIYSQMAAYLVRAGCDVHEMGASLERPSSLSVVPPGPQLPAENLLVGEVP